MSARLDARIRGRLRAERGTIRKPAGAAMSVCLCYPNLYPVGMSSLGFQGVYSMLNAMQDVVCERAFLPEDEDAEDLTRTGSPLVSYESQRPLRSFDMLAFSVSFENDYVNVLRVLELAGIPLYANQRPPGSGYPLVAMGGVCASSNPEPVADFLDIVFVGEAEAVLPRFMDVYRSAPDKAALIRMSARIEGVYAPGLYEARYEGDAQRLVPLGDAPPTVTRAIAGGIEDSPIRHAITCDEAGFSGMTLVEAVRGCPWNCAFCLAGHLLNPPRVKPVESIRREAEAARGHGSKAGLIASSLGDYPAIGEAMQIDGVEFTITSLRAGGRTAGLIEALGGRPSVSIAPEAGTDRLRTHINKRVSEEDILDTAGRILRAGVKKLRLYFMVGLPTETDEDIEGIMALVERIASLERSRNASISVTLSVFVPKPHTPFEREPMADEETVKSRIRRIKKGLARAPRVTVRNDSVRAFHLQGLLSRGDRRVGGVLIEMARGGSLKHAARAAGIDPPWCTERRIPPGEPLPWDFIRLSHSG